MKTSILERPYTRSGTDVDSFTDKKSDGITILPLHALWLRDPIGHLMDSTVGNMDVVAATGFLAFS